MSKMMLACACALALVLAFLAGIYGVVCSNQLQTLAEDNRQQQEERVSERAKQQEEIEELKRLISLDAAKSGVRYDTLVRKMDEADTRAQVERRKQEHEAAVVQLRLQSKIAAISKLVSEKTDKSAAGIESAIRHLREIDGSARDRDIATQQQLAALGLAIRQLRYPPLREGEKPLFSVRFSSVWPPKPYFPKDAMPDGHLETFLVRQEPWGKPEESFTRHVRQMFRAGGSDLREVINNTQVMDDDWDVRTCLLGFGGNVLGSGPMVHAALYDWPAQKCRAWSIAWKYNKKTGPPIGIMGIEAYDDRIRVLWYPARIRKESLATAELREAGLSLARALGLKPGKRSEWGPIDGAEARDWAFNDIHFKE